MITIYGALGLNDFDPRPLTDLGQEVVYDATLQVLGDHNADMEELESFFVERPTEKYQIVYKLAGGGFLQDRGRRSPTGEVKGGSQYTIQLPLEDKGASIAFDRIVFAYMTLPDLDQQLQTVTFQDKASRKLAILRALFNKDPRPFYCEIVGDLTISPLANGDGVKYPPIVGATDLATENHYIGSAADWTTINDSKNPIPIVVKELEEHFGKAQGGSAIVILCNSAQSGGIEGLADFVPTPDQYIAYGDNVSLALEELFPQGLPPGKVIGRCNGATIVEWDEIPAGYLSGFHLRAKKPLLKRLDTAASGLPAGLQLLPESSVTPFNKYEWSDRFGYGVGNRLNGVMMDLTNAGGAGSYTTPSAYAY